MGSNLDQVEKYSAMNYSSRPDTGGGGVVGHAAEEEGLLHRSKPSSNNHLQSQNQNQVIYRRFSICSGDDLGLVIPNKAVTAESDVYCIYLKFI